PCPIACPRRLRALQPDNGKSARATSSLEWSSADSFRLSRQTASTHPSCDSSGGNWALKAIWARDLHVPLRAHPPLPSFLELAHTSLFGDAATSSPGVTGSWALNISRSEETTFQ